MRQLIVLLVVVGVIGGGAYMWVFKKKEIDNLMYPPAKTSKEAADKFRDAIKERNYNKASKYVTKAYAEMLVKSNDAAKELGSKLDDLTSRLKDDGLLTPEIQFILFGIDPFPKELQIIVGKEGDKEAAASFGFDAPKLGNQNRPLENWTVDFTLWGALYKNVPGNLRIVKEGEGEGEWKIDFPTPPAMQAAVTKLNEKYKDYVNPLKVVSQEVKNDPTTKENVTRRLKEEIEKAAKN